MATTGERMLELLSLFTTRHRWSGDELTKRLGVSGRTLRRDVDRLRGLGYPIHADRGTDGGYRLGSGSRLPPLLVNRSEAVALAVGLRHAAGLPIANISEAAISALVKVADLLPNETRREFESVAAGIQAPTGSMADVSFDVLSGLARASRDSERVRFGYCSAGGEHSERSVEPYRVVPVGRRWYLVAWDLTRDDWRIFRLDRVSDLHVAKRRFEPRTLPAADAASFVAERLSSLPATYQVNVVVAAPEDRVQRHLGSWGSAEAIDANTTQIKMDVDDLTWVVLMLAAIDADISHVEPPELAVMLQTLGKRFANIAPRSDTSLLVNRSDS